MDRFSEEQPDEGERTAVSCAAGRRQGGTGRRPVPAASKLRATARWIARADGAPGRCWRNAERLPGPEGSRSLSGKASPGQGRAKG